MISRMLKQASTFTDTSLSGTPTYTPRLSLGRLSDAQLPCLTIVDGHTLWIPRPIWEVLDGVYICGLSKAPSLRG